MLLVTLPTLTTTGHAVDVALNLNYDTTVAKAATQGNESDSSMGLWDVYLLAVSNDPTFQADSLTYQADLQKVKQARAPLLPSLSADVAYVRNRDEVDAPGQPFVVQGSGNYNSDGYSLSLLQPVYDRGKILEYRQAQSQAKVAELQFQIAKQSLIVRVTTRYLLVLAAQDNLELAVAERTALARQLELADERLQVGLGTTTDLYDAEARFRIAEADEITARSTLADANQSLAELIGQVLDRLRVLKPDAPLTSPEPDDVQHWIAAAQAGNLELAASQQTAAVAEQEIGRQRAGHYPSLDFVVSHEYLDANGSISGPGRETTFTDAMLQLSIPLVQGGAVVSRTEEARLRYDAALRQVETARRAADRDVRAAFLDVTGSIRQAGALDRAVTASDSAVEAKQEGFAAGLNTNLEVLDAQRDLFEARRNYLKARYDYILNWLRLKQVVGTLTEADLQRAGTWLQ
jgi:outer membrane protein